MEKEEQSTTLGSSEWQTHESVVSEQHDIRDGMAVTQELRAEGGSEGGGRSEESEEGNGRWAGETNEEGKGEELDEGKEEGEGSDKHEEREERREGSDEHKEEEGREDSNKYEGEERRGEGELRWEEHTTISMVQAHYTASQADDESSKQVWGDKTDDPLVQQGRNVDGPQVEQLNKEQLNTAQVQEDVQEMLANLGQHPQTDEQLLFSQEKREDGTTVSEEAAASSRGVPEHIQQWRDEQQARMQQGGEPLPTPVHLEKENERERTAQGQDVEAFNKSDWENKNLHAGEEWRQEGHEQSSGQEREVTGTSQDNLRSKDDGGGDVDEEREREEMVKEGEQDKMENLDLSQDSGQTPPPPLYDHSTHTDTLLPTPSTTYTPSPEVPLTSQSATHSVTASSSHFQEFDGFSDDLEPDEEEDEGEEKDEDVEVRSLVTKSGKHAKVLFSRNGLVKVEEEGNDGYYLNLKSSRNGFNAEDIDGMFKDVIHLIGKEPDPVDHKEQGSSLDMHTQLPSSIPLSHFPPSPEVGGSGHYPSPGDYLNVNVIRQRMLRDHQVHPTQPPLTDQAQPPTDQAQLPPTYQTQLPYTDQAQSPPTDQAQPPPTDQAQPPSADQAQPLPTNQAQPPPTDQAQLPTADQAQPPSADQAQPLPTNQAQPTSTDHTQPPPTDHTQPFLPGHAQPLPTDHTHPPPTDHTHPPPDEHAEHSATMTTGYDQTGFTFEARDSATELQHTPTPSITPSVEISDTLSETPMDREGLPGFVDTKDTGDTQVEPDSPPSFPPPTQPSVQELPSEEDDPKVLEMQEEDSVPAPLHPPLYGGDQQDRMEEEQQEQRRDEIETTNMERRAEEHDYNEEEKEREELIPEPREMKHLGGRCCCGYRCVAFRGTCLRPEVHCKCFILLQILQRTTTSMWWCNSSLSHSEIGYSSR